MFNLSSICVYNAISDDAYEKYIAMYLCNVWEGIDKVEFHEIAMLLDVKTRSQGSIEKRTVPIEDAVDLQDTENLTLSEQTIFDFLDDFALVAAGSGSHEHISSACLDREDEKDGLVIRVAKNDGISDRSLSFLSNLVAYVTNVQDFVLEMPQRKEEVLKRIVEHCKSKLRGKTMKLKTVTREYKLKSAKQRRAPKWNEGTGVLESSKDAALLGTYSQETHTTYMTLCEARLGRMEELVSKVALNQELYTVPSLTALTKLGFELHRSTSFRNYLAANLIPPKNRALVFTRADEIVDRIGKLSKYCRASMALTVVGYYFASKGIALKIGAVPAHRLPLHAISQRTIIQLNQRWGSQLKDIQKSKLQAKLDDWAKYRQHAEIQLLIYYEEHPGIKPYKYYLGCSKLCCYLCYNLIKAHNVFEVRGTHQSLYSLWTVRNEINFLDESRAEAFQKALQDLSKELKKRLQLARSSGPRRISVNESIANLSRASLPMSDYISRISQMAQQQGRALEQADTQNIEEAITVLPESSSSHTSGRNELASASHSTAVEDVKSRKSKNDKESDLVLNDLSSVDEQHSLTSETLQYQRTSWRTSSNKASATEDDRLRRMKRKKRANQGRVARKASKRQTKAISHNTKRWKLPPVEVRRSWIVYRKRKHKRPKQSRSRSALKHGRKSKKYLEPRHANLIARFFKFCQLILNHAKNVRAVGRK